MDQDLYNNLFTPQELNHLLESDFSYRRSRDPKALEAFIQQRHRAMMEAALDIARAEIILVKTQTDRFRTLEQEQYKNRERSYVHPDLQLRPNGYSWVASWRKGGYIKTKDGRYVARHQRIPTNLDGNFPVQKLRCGPKWSQDLAQDCEAEYVKLRLLNTHLVRIRDAIYRSSRQWRQFFDTQPGCQGFENRACALTQKEVEETFAQRYELKKNEKD